MSFDTIAPNILVTIPTNRKLNNGQRTFNKQQQAEIKSEEIVKSELESVQIPTSQSNFLNSLSITAETASNNAYPIDSMPTTSNHVTSSLVTARPKSSSTIKCFKCKYCPFISIEQASMEAHEWKHNENSESNVTTSEKPNRKKLFCPGCDNVFYSRKPFKAHLLNDHQMSHEDSIVLLKSCLSTTKKPTKVTSNSQKIYLKNVEVLKNPNPTPIQAQNVRNFASNAFSNDSCFKQQQQPLQENSICIDLDDSDGRCSSSLDMSNEPQIETDFFRNKFFVRDVNNMNKQSDSMQCNYGNGNNYLTAASNILPHRNIPQSSNASENLQAFDFGYSLTAWKEPPANYEHSNCIDSYTNNSFGMSNHLSNSSTNLNVVNMPMQRNDNFEYLRYMSSDNDSHSIASNEFENGYMANTPSPGISAAGSVTDERKKIFIKNIDILKKPIVPTANPASSNNNNRKSTLHLRTVDEVNLMLINKVHNETYYSTEPVCNIDNNCVPEKCSSVAAASNYSDYEFLQPLNNASPTLNYYNPMTSNHINDQPISNMRYDTSNDNTVIILDDVARSSDERSIEKYPDTMESHRVANQSDNYSSSHEYTSQNATNFLEANDFIIVSSEEIINNCEDILDLTTDEVEQIFDDNNLMSNNIFNQSMGDVLPSIKIKQHTAMDVENHSYEPIQWENKLPHQESMEKFEEESEKLNLQENTVDVIVDVEASNDVSVKRKGGRPKGARKPYYSADGQRIFTYKCSKINCCIRFASQTTLEFHESCHTTSTKTGIFCPKCDHEENRSIDYNWNTLHTHLWRRHTIDMELYKCKECPFRTPILSRLNNTHQKIHSNVKGYKCDICDKCFKNAKQLKNHRRIHTGNSVMHKCEHCNKSFFNLRYLKVHIGKNHVSMANIKCDICYKSFATEQECKTHRGIHFGEKKFHCPTCKYKSNDHNALRRHQMTHSKEALYKCPACSFQCIQSTSYKTHIIKKHSELAKDLIFSCSCCDFKTVNKKIFDVHQLKHDNERNSLS